MEEASGVVVQSRGAYGLDGGPLSHAYNILRSWLDGGGFGARGRKGKTRELQLQLGLGGGCRSR